MTKKFINGVNIYLEELNYRNVNKNYQKWLKNKSINKYLEVRFKKNINTKYVREFIKNSKLNKNIILFGIFTKLNVHIGNLKLELNRDHKRSDLGILIGEKKYFGKGFGTEAIKLATKFIFENTKIEFMYAGIYRNNIASITSFKRSKWKRNGVLKNYWLFENKRVDEIVFSITKNEFKKTYKK